MNLLFIDDDDYYLDQYQRNFSGFGNIRTVATANEIDQWIKEFYPEIIVSELMFGNTTLYELLDELMQTVSDRYMPKIVVFSKFSHERDIQAALNHGVNHFLVKGHDTLNDLKSLLLSGTQHILHGL